MGVEIDGLRSGAWLLVRCTQSAGRCRCVGGADEAVLGSPCSLPLIMFAAPRAPPPPATRQPL